MSSMSRYAIGVSLFALVLVWVTGVVAAPLEVERRAISTDVFSKLKFFSQYSAAAYCEGNNNSTGTKIVCPVGNCPDVQSANTNTVSEFENSLATDVTGFVATDSTNQLIVISFRGSQSLRNWITNLNFPVDETDICADCEASRGFWRSWKEAQGGVLTAVKTARAENPNFKLVSTGHSLGGALASLAAGVLRSQGVTVDLYTYGAPKIGQTNLVKYLSQTDRGSNFRVTHLDDPVPRLPPSLFGYRHISPEYYISSGNTAQPTANDVTRYEGVNNKQGNEKDTGFSVDAHVQYFGHISGCGGDDFEFKMKRDLEMTDIVKM
ncbi:alpha/beta-hydrolase [Zopfia rhizophila CBS 207.26]|uniref:Alpha/beta-hydrolase n=1 Tax=Zopfia rhizophila CBS 207.26 TaxID=1314779 RepID=A0A6A6ESK0_9PEZI|nr:alpha/beta-hydrolase [Zopfia rhizophila CBS 207.26]